MSSTKKRSRYFSDVPESTSASSPPFKRVKLGETPKTVSSASKLAGPPARLGRAFFDVPCDQLARKLIGTELVRRHDEHGLVRARIVETEAYLGGDDKASHSYQGKVTAKNAAMFMQPGTLYVYTIYGIYFCLNVCACGDGAAVLFRSTEPADERSAAAMQKLRSKSAKSKQPKQFKNKELCGGPARMTQALDIGMSFNEEDCTAGNDVWFEEGSRVEDADVVVTSRVGVGNAGPEWAGKPLRFYVRGSKFVSVRDKEKEKEK